MSGAAPDLIAGYLEELYAGLPVPAAEAELIAAEAEDHLRETAAAGIAIGMTELEAQQAAISSFGPVRAVVRAHRRRAVTAGGAAMAAWKLAALLATTVGAGGLAGMGIFAYPPVACAPSGSPGSRHGTRSRRSDRRTAGRCLSPSSASAIMASKSIERNDRAAMR
jgi:HAAS domain-containing protein